MASGRDATGLEVSSPSDDGHGGISSGGKIQEELILQARAPMDFSLYALWGEVLSAS